MGKIQLSYNKTLKLTNVLRYKLDLMDEDINLDILIEQMRSYIQVKGANQIGPLIQYTNSFINESGEMEIEMQFLLQCSSFIHAVEPPYHMESVLRVPGCMYVRYTGPEDKLNLAYNKIHLEAFEEDISLKGDSYTIFVDRNDEESVITADVFMEKEN